MSVTLCRRTPLSLPAIVLLGLGVLLAPTAATSAAAGKKRAPEPAPMTARATAPSVRHYLLPSQVDIVSLLPPPPAAESAEQRADLAAVLEAQHAAHASGSVNHAVDDVEANCGRFADVVGDELNLKANAAVLAFLNEAALEAAAVAGAAKEYWKRTRPYAYSGEVERLGDMLPDWKSVPRIDADKAADALAHSSYPSGHATFGTVCAILLAEIVPEKRAALFERSRDFEHSRMVVGAHFPSDLRAGEITGTVAAQMLLQNVGFERDLAAARTTLRQALGLPAQLPPAAIDAEP
ncbi:MAG: phosphatase PAP2 family protein [Steroidobacteraceae bacterium]